MPEIFPPVSASSPALPTPAAPGPSHRWVWWLLGICGLLLGLGLVVQHFLDPWLRRKLEKQVATQTHGQYRLHIDALETSLWQRAIRLRGVRLRPAAQVADTLPRVRLDAARLHLTGIGLLALLRKSVVPIDSVVLDSARIEVLALAQKSTRNAGQPLHERLPLKMKGLEIGYFGLQHTQVNYAPGGQSTARFQRADLSAHDLHLSSAGAADTQRIAYAAAWNLKLLRAQAQAQGHHLGAKSLTLSTEDKEIQLDSLQIRPDGPATGKAARVNLSLPRLRLTGLQPAILQHRHQLRADSLLLQDARLTLVPPAGKSGGASDLGRYVRSLDLAHVVVQRGYFHLADDQLNATVRGIAVKGTGLHVDSTGAGGGRRLFFAKAWEVAAGRSQATGAAHAISLTNLNLSTTAGSFDLRGVRVRPPAPGQGQPGGVRVDLTLPSLAVRGLDAAALQRQRQLRASSVVLAGGRLIFSPPKTPPPPVWKLLAKAVRRTDVAELRVERSFFKIGGLRHSPEINDINLTARGIRIDSLAALTPSRIIYARGWKGSSGRISAPFDPPYYRAYSQRARLDTDARTFHFGQMELRPRFTPVQLNLRKGYQVSALAIQVPALDFSGLDFAGLVRRADVRAARVVLTRPTVRISSDGRGPINPHRSKISPEEMRKLPVTVDVRRLDIVNGNLSSRYRSPRTPIPGTLGITRFTGTFRNLSNDRRRQTRATPLTGRATTYLQNRVRLDAQVSMYLLDPNGQHRVWGTFGSGPFNILNSMTVPTRLVEFKKGDVQRIRFDMQANRQGTTGTMWAQYSGLQLELLGYKQEEIKKTLIKRIISKAVNVIVIRDQNPRKRGKLVSGQMISTREPRFSVFTLWRQGVVSGLFDNVGVPQKLAQKLSESKDEAPLPK
ncbi:hypothetical protein Q5H92_17350 [Hymenobacter sp. M29]|uniref:Dicarboxylate transport domain-containing protein n=1 Tax=Hymenobacter mellowenesis TaxID=3063995 RepID=A0ABT9AGR9_9BACT|nr:hypothetical protein [Hymenobacter sp. M29]MDO7848136.1 hypothetical protein [Hymenobacter sp. M29]